MENLSGIQIQIMGAIGDITKAMLALILLNAGGFGVLALHFYASHFNLFLLFVGLALAAATLGIAVWLVLPVSAPELFEPLHDDERIGQRTANSWKPKD